jgi:hypothetical protein
MGALDLSYTARQSLCPALTLSCILPESSFMFRSKNCFTNHRRGVGINMLSLPRCSFSATLQCAADKLHFSKESILEKRCLLSMAA